MESVEDTIRAAEPQEAINLLIACVKRLGQLGIEAGEIYQLAAEDEAGDPDFENGLSLING